MMNNTRNAPGTVVAASSLLGVAAVGGILIAAAATYVTLTTTGMGLLAVPLFILLGAVALAGAVGCAVAIPRLLKGTRRVAATWFAVALLLPTVLATFITATNLFSRLDYSPTGPLDYLPAAAGLVLSLCTIAAIALLWVPPTSGAFFARHPSAPVHA